MWFFLREVTDFLCSLYTFRKKPTKLSGIWKINQTWISFIKENLETDKILRWGTSKTYEKVPLFSLTWKALVLFSVFWRFSLIISFADVTELQYSLCQRKLIYVLSRFTYADLTLFQTQPHIFQYWMPLTKVKGLWKKIAGIKMQESLNALAVMNGEHILNVNLASLELL